MADDLEAKVTVAVDAKVPAGPQQKPSGTSQPVRIAAMDRPVTDSLANALGNSLASALVKAAPAFGVGQAKAALATVNAQGKAAATTAAAAPARGIPAPPASAPSTVPPGGAGAKFGAAAGAPGAYGGLASQIGQGYQASVLGKLGKGGGQGLTSPLGNPKDAANVLGTTLRYSGFDLAAQGAKKLVDLLDLIPARVKALIGVAGITGLGYASLRAAGQVQTLRLNFEGALGGASQAADAVAHFQETTARIPVSLAALAQVHQTFLGIGQSAARAGEEARTAILLAAGSFGPFDQAVTQLGAQMARLGTAADASLSDVMGFAGKGIPVFKLLEDQLARTGRTVRGSLMGMLERGELSGATVKAALEAGASKYGDLLDKRSRSLGGMWTRISSATQGLFAALGERVAKWFDVEGVQGKFLGLIGTLTSNVGALDAIMARLGGAFQGAMSFGLTFFEGIAKGLGAASGQFGDLRAIQETWKNATIDALGFVAKGFLAFSETVTRTVGVVVEGVGRVVEAVQGVGQALDYINPSQKNARTLFSDLADVGSFVTGQGVPIRGRAGQTAYQQQGAGGQSLVSLGQGLQATNAAGGMAAIDRMVAESKAGGGPGGAPGAAGTSGPARSGGILGGWAANLVELGGNVIPGLENAGGRLAERLRGTALAADDSGEKIRTLELSLRKFQLSGETVTEKVSRQATKFLDLVSQERALGESTVSDRDVTATKAGLYEQLYSGLSPFLEQQTKTAGAAGRYTQTAYSAEVAFRQEGRVDITERMAQAQQAQLEQDKIRANLLERILQKLGDNSVAIVPRRPGS